MNNIFIQCEDYVLTLNPTGVKARIYTPVQREVINNLIRDNYLPHHTAVGKGNCTRKHWALKEYDGRYGRGYILITSSRYSHNFNHITYFINY